MNIKNKKKYAIMGVGLISASVITVFCVRNVTNASKNVGPEELEKLGAIIDQNPVFQDDMAVYSNEGEEGLYAVGDNIAITQAEMDWKIRANEILNIANPEETAYESLSKLKSEYYYALGEGYECTDEEIDENLQAIRELYQSILDGEDIGNSEETVALINASGGIDAYCDKIRDIFGKELVIKKFYLDREQEFKATLDESIDTNEAEELWSQEQEKISKEIVENEHIHKVTDTEAESEYSTEDTQDDQETENTSYVETESGESE